jgi:diguanylate cyclase
MLLALSPAPAVAHEAVVTIDSAAAFVDLMPYLEVLEDPSGQLAVEDVARGPAAGGFAHADHGGTLSGYSRSAFWLRLTVRAPPVPAEPLLLVIGYPLLDHVDFYEPLPEGGFRHRQSGDAVPFAARALPLRLPVFETVPPQGESRTYYLRLASTGPVHAPLRLWRKDAFLVHLESAQLWLGAFTGAMVVVTGLALLLYVVMRDRLFLLFSGFLGGYTLLQLVLSGLAFQYLWPAATAWASQAPSVLVAVTALFISAFSREFLDTRVRLRPLDLVLRLSNPLGAAVIAAAFIDIALAIRLSVAYGLGVCLMAILGGLLLAVRGQRSAGYFTAALIAFLLGMATASMSYLGEASYGALTANAMQVGSALLVVLTAIAVSDRIRSLLRSRAHAAESAQRYLTALNQELERLVSDRTAALERSNAELKQLASRDSLTGLLNHRATVEELERLLKSAFRYGEPLVVAMADIDHFKEINDHFGHQVGDGVLTALSRVLSSSVRAGDVCGRYGGEEFLLLLPKATAATGGELAERLRQAIEELHLPALAGAVVTASFGVAAVDPLGPAVVADAVIRRADDALYRAKREGRNRVHVEPAPHAPRLEAVRRPAS